MPFHLQFQSQTFQHPISCPTGSFDKSQPSITKVMSLSRSNLCVLIIIQMALCIVIWKKIQHFLFLRILPRPRPVVYKCANSWSCTCCTVITFIFQPFNNDVQLCNLALSSFFVSMLIIFLNYKYSKFNISSWKLIVKLNINNSINIMLLSVWLLDEYSTDCDLIRHGSSWPALQSHRHWPPFSSGL